MMTRTEARAAGLRRYSDGKRCPEGHVGERYVSNGGCVECAIVRAVARYHADPERERALKAARATALTPDQRERARARSAEYQTGYYAAHHVELQERQRLRRTTWSPERREAERERRREIWGLRAAARRRPPPGGTDRG